MKLEDEGKLNAEGVEVAVVVVAEVPKARVGVVVAPMVALELATGMARVEEEEEEAAPKEVLEVVEEEAKPKPVEGVEELKVDDAAVGVANDPAVDAKEVEEDSADRDIKPPVPPEAGLSETEESSVASKDAGAVTAVAAVLGSERLRFSIGEAHLRSTGLRKGRY